MSSAIEVLKTRGVLESIDLRPTETGWSVSIKVKNQPFPAITLKVAALNEINQKLITWLENWLNVKRLELERELRPIIILKNLSEQIEDFVEKTDDIDIKINNVVLEG